MMVPTRKQEFLYGLTKESLQKYFEEQVLEPIRGLTQRDIEEKISKHELNYLNPDERFEFYLVKKIELLEQRVSQFNEQYHPNDTQLNGWMDQTRSRLLTELFMLDRPTQFVEARDRKMKEGSSMGDLLSTLTEKINGFLDSWIWNYPNDPHFFAKTNEKLVKESIRSTGTLDNHLNLIRDARKHLVVFQQKGYYVNIPLLETLDLLAILNRQDTIQLINQYCPSWWGTIALNDLRRTLHGELESPLRSFRSIGQKIREILLGEKRKKRKNENMLAGDLPPAIRELARLVEQGVIPMDDVLRLIDQAASDPIEFSVDGEVDPSRLANNDLDQNQSTLEDFLSRSDDQSDQRGIIDRS